jgi:hypothetical protein
MEWCEAVHIRAARYALIKTAANSYRFQANGDLSCSMVAVDGSIRDQVSNQSVFFDGNNNNSTMICMDWRDRSSAVNQRKPLLIETRNDHR